MQSQGRLDDVVRRTAELRVLCAQARADAATLKVDTAELLAATAATRETALRARERSHHRLADLDAVIHAAQELKRTRISSSPPARTPGSGMDDTT